MELEFPRIIDSAVFFGHMGFHLNGSNLDCLIEVLGEPAKTYYLEDDSRFQIFSFDYSMGQVNAYLFFNSQNADPPYFIEGEDISDRGFLVELQVELIEPLHLRKYGNPLSIIQNKQYKFAVFSNICLVRMISRRRFDAISFLNPISIKSPKKSFMYQRIWAIDKPIHDLREELELEREKNTKEIIDLACQTGLIIPINLQGPTKK